MQNRSEMKLAWWAAVAAFAAAALAMPTKSELLAAQGMAHELAAECVKSLSDGRTTPCEAAAAHIAIAETAKSSAIKFLLLQSAFKLHARGGDLKSAAEVIARMERDFKPLPPELVMELMDGELRPGSDAPQEWSDVRRRATRSCEHKARIADAFAKKKDFRLDLDGAHIDFVVCPPGMFKMGYSSDEKSAYFAHAVTLTHPFWLSSHPITVGQWTALMGEPSLSPMQNAVGPAMALNRDWRSIHKMAAALQDIIKTSMPSGYVVRLPTEAEWQYAARAGSNSPEDPHSRIQMTRAPPVGKEFGPYRTTEDELANKLQAMGFKMKHTPTQTNRMDKTNRLELPYYSRVFPQMGMHKPNAWGFHDFLQEVGFEVVADTVRAAPDNDCRFRNTRADYFFAPEEIDPIKSAGTPVLGKVDVLFMTWYKLHSSPDHPKMIFRLAIGPDLKTEKKLRDGASRHF